MNILLGVSGSIAAKLGRKLWEEIEGAGHEARCIITNSSKNFLDKKLIDICLTDEHEWCEYEMHERVLHIDLVKWCDIFVIAPCTANTLGKISNGISDNLLTCCVTAYPKDKKLILAPAMNCQMWSNSIVQNNLEKICSNRFIKIVPPIEKKLYCGDEGIGAMAHIEDIITSINETG